MFTLFQTPEPIVQITACQASPNLILEGASGQFYILGFPKSSGASLEEVHFEFNQDDLWISQAGGSILIAKGDYDENYERLRLELIQGQKRAFPVCTAHFWEVKGDNWLDFFKLGTDGTLLEARRLDLLESNQIKP